MRVDICKIWFYICREVRGSQLGIIGSEERIRKDLDENYFDLD
jgi:hypothetical protein